MDSEKQNNYFKEGSGSQRVYNSVTLFAKFANPILVPEYDPGLGQTCEVTTEKKIRPPTRISQPCRLPTTPGLEN